VVTEESKEIYRFRKMTVEPTIGNIKQNLGFREFLLKGLEKVKIEINLVSIAHNLQKIWKLSGVAVH
jgi:transposase